MKKIIDETESLSPLTGRPIPAQVVQTAKGVYLEKEDEQGKFYCSLIEKDIDFYHSFKNEKRDLKCHLEAIVVFVSSQCNLRCSFCYEEKGSREKEPNLLELEQFVSTFKNKHIALGGLEPTCRDNLDDVIRIVAKNNYAELITNGLKLSDMNYVKGLKEAGLKSVFFSFNGMKEAVYKEINSAEIFEDKLKALANLKILKIPTVISATIVRGVNDQEINKLYEFCRQNKDFIRQLRIRSATNTGRYVKVEAMPLSELLDLVCSALTIDKQSVINEQKLFNELAELFGLSYFRRRRCSLFFHLKDDDKGEGKPVGRYIKEKLILHKWFRYVLIPYYMFSCYGIKYILKQILILLNLPHQWVKTDIFRIGLRSWPDMYTIDLQENRKCTTGYYRGGKLEPFCYTNIVSNYRAE